MQGIFLTKFISIFILITLLFSENIYALTLPSAVSNGVFHLDAQDINGNNSTLDEPLDGSTVDLWGDKFLAHSGSQSTILKRPIYETNSLNGYPIIRFNGSNHILEMQDESEVNLGISYAEKSFAFMIQTDSDILSPQILYEQSIREKGYSLQIDNGNLYFGTWNTDFWVSPDDYKVIDLGPVASLTPYRIIITQGTTMSGYVDGVFAGTATNVGLQTAHGQCTFDTGFGCAMFDTGGSIGIGGVQNDSIRLSNLTTISAYQSNWFMGYIGEMISWNHTLSASEVIGIDEYLQSHWGFDIVPPIITSINIASGTLIPTSDFTLTVGYSDTGSAISPSSFTGRIYAWDSTGATWNITNIAPTYMSITGTTTSSTGQLRIAGLSFGKYRFDIIIADTLGNTLTESYTYFVDSIDWTISAPTYDIGSSPLGADTFGTGELVVTVRTVGAGFDVSMIRTDDLTYITDIIPVYSGSTGWGYSQWNGSIFPPTITSHGTNQMIASVPKSINTNGERNTFVYRLKYAINPHANNPAGEYSGQVRFTINLTY